MITLNTTSGSLGSVVANIEILSKTIQPKTLCDLGML
jgi:hypothetical protein